MHTKWTWLIVIGIGSMIGGCADSGNVQKGPPGPNVQPENNQGYSLLYKLMKDESQVGKIFVLKSADDSVKTLIKQIGTRCDAAKKEMDKLHGAETGLNWDAPGLPYMEQRSRDVQSKADEKELLFSSGKTFEVRLVFTQAQAMSYAAMLCKALDEKEQDGVRKLFLEGLEKDCTAYHDQLMKMLTVTP